MKIIGILTIVCCLFSTVFANNFGNSNNGSHPISGNRQFGYNINASGHMEIFTKGVDRFLSPSTNGLPGSWTSAGEKMAGYLLEKIAFSGADGLWSSFQQGLVNFVNSPSNQGVSIVNTPKKYRPKVRDSLKELLKKNEPLNYVPCGG